MLVVVTIIAILASLLLPALTSVRSKAQQIDCVNRLKQVGMVQALYAEGEDGFLATSRHGWAHRLWDAGYVEGDTVPAMGEATSFTNIVNGENLLWCESPKHHNKYLEVYGGAYRDWNHLWGSVTRWGRSTYGISAVWNSGFKQNDADGQQKGPRKLPLRSGDVYKPAERVFIGDGTDFGGCMNSQDHTLGTPHAERANMLFGGFHVESISRNEIYNTGSWWSSTWPWGAP